MIDRTWRSCLEPPSAGTTLRSFNITAVSIEVLAVLRGCEAATTDPKASLYGLTFTVRRIFDTGR
jgi:hypothetical protein